MRLNYNLLLSKYWFWVSEIAFYGSKWIQITEDSRWIVYHNLKYAIYFVLFLRPRTQMKIQVIKEIKLRCNQWQNERAPFWHLYTMLHFFSYLVAFFCDNATVRQHSNSLKIASENCEVSGKMSYFLEKYKFLENGG